MAETSDGIRSSKTDEKCLLFRGLQEVSHDVRHVIPEFRQSRRSQFNEFFLSKDWIQ